MDLITHLAYADIILTRIMNSETLQYIVVAQISLYSTCNTATSLPFCLSRKCKRNYGLTSSTKKQKKSPACVKRPWSNEHRQPNADLELCKVMHSFQKSLEASCKLQDENTTMSADVHYCLSLAERMSKLDDRLKVYVRHCIEKIFFDLEFGNVMSSNVGGS